MPQFEKEFKDALAKRGRGDDIADVVGMPDEKDYEVLMGIVRKYELKHPGYIDYAVQQGRHDYGLGVHSKKKMFDRQGRAVISKDSNMVYAFELPADLVAAIEKVFPSMFRSKRHFAWFRKNFQKLMVGEG